MHDAEVEKFLEGDAPCIFMYLSRHSGELLVGRQIPSTHSVGSSPSGANWATVDFRYVNVAESSAPAAGSTAPDAAAASPAVAPGPASPPPSAAGGAASSWGAAAAEASPRAPSGSPAPSPPPPGTLSPGPPPSMHVAQAGQVAPRGAGGRARARAQPNRVGENEGEG